MSAFRNSAGALALAAVLLGGARAQEGGGVPHVDVQALDAVDPSAAGTLSDADGGLGDALWAGSDYAAIAGLMEEMPVATASPVMNDLARRLLLTGARPEGARGEGSNLFDIRSRKLAEAGLAQDLVALLGVAGSKAGDAGARVEALLLTGQEPEACAVAIGESTLALQLQALCRIVEGNTAAAALSADLASVKGVEDPAFYALVANLADGTPLDGAALKGLTPVTLALARRAKAPLGLAAIDGASSGTLAAIAAYTDAPMPTRVTAGELAAAEGAMTDGALIDLFRAVAKPGRDGAEGGALRLQKAIAAEGLEPRAKAIVEALDFGAGRGFAVLYARMLARAAWETPPSNVLAPYADPITCILLLSGRGDRVADWLNVAGGLGERLRDELAVRLTIAAPTRDRAAVAVSALVRLVAASETDAALQGRLLIYAGALDALGFAIPSSAQSLLQSSPLMAGATAGQVETTELAAAARDRHTGETLLRALILLGRGGPAKAHPATVIEAVAALSAAGFPHEASAVALEAALARQTPGEGG